MSEVFPVIPDARYRISTASSNQTAFTVSFPFFGQDELTVFKTGLDGIQAQLSRPADYTVSGAGNPAGGTVTLKRGARAGEVLLIVGDATRTRANSVVRGGKFNSAAMDEDFDRLTLIAQEHDREIARAVKADYGVTPPNLTAGAAGTVAVWDADGNLGEGPEAAALESIEVALGVEAGRALVYPAAPAAEKYDAHAHIIENVLDGVAAQDAVTVAQLEALAADVGIDGINDRFDAVEASVALGWTTGDLKISMSDDEQDGWLFVDAKTIGDASSGGTARANADTEDLFTLIWTKYDNTASHIQTSSGVPSTRGANAAADYAAHRRLPLLAAGGEFLRFLDMGRGVDTDRELGSAQGQQILDHVHLFTGTAVPNHTHSVDIPTGGGTGYLGATVRSNATHYTATSAGGGGHTPAGSIGNPTANNGAENRPRNLAFPLFVKL